MAFFKKIVKIVQDNIGILTVVCPEVIIKKGWNANTDQVNDMMKIPAKQFYNYLGHWLTPDIGLKSGTYTEPYTPHEEFKGRGLGIGPFSYDPQSQCHNDLTKALDSQLYSNPGICDRKEHEENKPEDGPTQTIDQQDNVEFSFGWSESVDHHGGTKQDPRNNTLYKNVEATTHTYEWDGKWGDYENQFQTEVEFTLITKIENDRVHGNILGEYYPTGCLLYCWCGDENDYDKASDPNNYHKGKFSSPAIPNASTLKKFYNPYYASGARSAGNDGKMNDPVSVTITRRPFSQKLRWHFVIYTRGGHSTAGLYDFVRQKLKPGFLSSVDNLIGTITDKVPGVGNPMIGQKIWDAICYPFQFIDQILNWALGYGKPRYGRGQFVLKVKRKTVSVVNHNSCKAYPIMMNFGQISEWSYFYNQFEYPYFDRNPCHPFTTTFHYEKPFLENKVVESDYHFKNKYYDHKLGRKYKYFVPNLFRLTFETNPGVFIEQLSKQNEGKIQHPDGYSLLTKLEHHTSKPEPHVQRETNEQDAYLDQIVFPTNFDVWNSYIENGYPDDNLSWLQNFISSATNAATLKSPVMPLPYANALNRDYPFCDVNTVAEINQIIGLHSHIKTILESDKGYDVDTWSALCADPTQFQTLSSGVPKNLTYKLIEFMLWYLNKEGIAFKTRQSVKNLIAYEEYLDQRLEEYKGIPDVTDIDKFHTIGTQLYDRRCTESA